MVFSIQLAIFLFIEILRFNCEIYNLLSENIKRPFMGRCFCPGRYLDAVFGIYVPLLGTGSANVPAMKGLFIFSSRATNFAVTIRKY